MIRKERMLVTVSWISLMKKAVVSKRRSQSKTLNQRKQTEVAERVIYHS